LKGVQGLALPLAMVIAGALLYRAWQVHDGEKHLVIATPNGIDEALFVSVGGTPQWITVRGQSKDNPVVLMLHGGPGAGMSGFALSLLPWEKDFVVVQWDQPGAGRTFRAAGRVLDPDLTIERMARDGNDLTQWIENHLHKRNIILLGWSWGSALGIHMVRARPDLFAAYVGTGQIVSGREGEALAYTRVLTKARDRRDRPAIEELEQIGPPPYDSLAKLGTQRKWAAMYEINRSMLLAVLPPLFTAPRRSLLDGYASLSGMMQSQDHFFGPAMNGPFMNLDLRKLGDQFDLPMFVVEGTEDDFTPAALSRAYVEWLKAPQKVFVPIEGAGHLALITRGDAFLKIVTDRVRPLAR
jgi:pimeloyl-ACP methyl ester carboxylesterase